jgi:hypothetical protein
MTRVAGVLSCLLGLGFGIPCLLGAVHLARAGEVWTFLGFPTYGGGPFERIGLSTTVPLMLAFLLVCAAEVVVGVAVWVGAAHAASASYVLLPFELAFWIGFALPFGPVLGIPRTLIVLFFV